MAVHVIQAAFVTLTAPLHLFVGFNLAWLGIWVLSAWGLARRRQVALFPLWFLGIAAFQPPPASA